MNQSESNFAANGNQQIDGQIQALLRLKNQLEQRDDDLNAANALIASLQETVFAQEAALAQLEATASSQQDALDDVRAEAWTMAQQIVSHDSELVNSMMYIQVLEQALSTKAGVLPERSLGLPAWKLNLPAHRMDELRQPSATKDASTAMDELPTAASVQDEAGALDIRADSSVIFTIVSKNYLASARVLFQSIQQYQTDVVLVVVLVDEIDGAFEPNQEIFQVLPARLLGIPRWEHFSMKYDIMELNTAVKPYAMRYFMERFGAQKVIYFDPDIVVYQPLDHLLDLLDHYQCVLTPHITSPLNDDRSPGELDFLRVGTYNLGFFAISRRQQWQALLRWWEDRLYENCTREVERGLFVDQHWMDLTPSLFDLVYILRDPGYNVAYWNIAGRELAFEDGEYLVNGKPLVFFHFSGFSVRTPGIVSRHQNRFSFSNLSETYQRIYLEYRDALLDAGYEQTHQLPYAYGYFADGMRIPDILRACLRSYDSAGERWPHPFEPERQDNFRDWAARVGNIPPYKLLSPLALTLYKTRADLQAAFPDLAGSDQFRYATWFSHQEEPAEIFQPVFRAPITEALTEYKSGNHSAFTLTPLEAQRLNRVSSTMRYYRAFPNEVQPYLSPEAFEKPSAVFTGPHNLYGTVRNVFRRAGVLQWMRRKIGLRTVMSARHFFAYPAIDLRPFHDHGKPPVALDFAASPVRTDLQPGVRIVGYLKAETGVGQIARNLLLSVREAGFPSAGYQLDVQGIYREQDDTVEVSDRDENYVIQVFNVNADQTQPARQKLGDLFYRGHYNIGYWFWELAQFPERWNNAFETYEEIWVGSHFVREAVQANTNKLVTRMPVAIDVPLPENAQRSQFGLPEDGFLVLVSFDALSIMARKNPWGAIEAFRRAFPADERGRQARLIIKVNNLDSVPDAARLREAVRGVNGILMEQYLHRLEVNALMNLCDAYLSLHRSEGFGLGMAEAMYLGKPTIATGYSGNADFMNAENSYPIPYKLVPLGEAYPPYPVDYIWAEPDVDAAAALLRAVFDAPDEARYKGNLAARYIRAHYSHKAAGEQITRRLNAILRMHGYSSVQTPTEALEQD